MGTSANHIGVASAGLAVLLFSTVATAPASASTAGTSPSAPCVLHSLASFADQGEGSDASSVADVIQVECKPVYAEDEVTVYSTEFDNACQGTLTWNVDPFLEQGDWYYTSSADAYLDDDGNATVVAWGGPSCAPTTVDIFASLDAPPYPTAQTTFTIQAPHQTKHGAFALPASAVQDASYSSVATIVQVELPSGFAGQLVQITSEELYDRCEYSEWIGPDEDTYYGYDTPSTDVTLDNDGNAFVGFVGEHCASGQSTIEASLDIAPYTSYTTTFTVLSPRPTH